MAIICDAILRDSATPAQLRALGSALWRWCNGGARDADVARSVDNQVLADLIAGQTPLGNQTPRQSEQRSDGIHFVVRDLSSNDRQATILSLRREIPREAIEFLVDGISWQLAAP